ncbi:hypothetical protein CYY_000071 [Polysphondylium violaceum]|uniref:Insulin-degrading enzyme n=1 Tax=Polysphondylium violaceum TaxID=133409 RepID=A0A8J4UXI6_9MYCE|nr:hypothetical protein CYY_000071 [Polysphondylium violaceum]
MVSAIDNIEIIKSPNDKRNYRYLKLDNQMEVLLVSDSAIDNAAVSLRVGVGSYLNPPEALGLAHFLEHMLFMGTEKYPIEKEFAQFISENGGSYNAGTSSVYTVYYYNINQASLKESLDRLSSFFICPLMSDSSTNREINAINSEHNGNIQNDVWRVANLRGMAFKDHPASRFSTGNFETLNKPGMRDRVVEFYNDNYSSNLIKLSIVGPQTLDALEEWTREYFSPIKNKNLPDPVHPPLVLDKSVYMHYVPVKSKNTLRIEWPIPDPAYTFTNFSKHTGPIISHLLGHESLGSLLSVLKKKNYAYGLSTYAHPTSKTIFSVVNDIDLTDTGLENIDEILNLNFQFMKLLDNIPKYVVEETIAHNTITWNNASKSRALDYSRSIVENLYYTKKPENVLKLRYFSDEIDLEEIKTLAQKYLTPENMLVVVGSDKFKGKTDLVAEYYGTEYSYVDITPERVEKWRSGFPTDPSLYIPAPNQFMPKKFDIKNEQNTTAEIPMPSLVYSQNGIDMYYSPDTWFNVPMAQIKVRFESEHMSGTRTTTNLFLFEKIAKDILNEEYLYDMILSGISVKFINWLTHFELKVSGYDDKIFFALKTAFSLLYAFDCSPECFSRAVEKVSTRYINYQLETPYQLAIKESNLYLSTVSSENQDKVNYLSQLKREDFVQWIRNYFKTISFTFFIFGNVTKEECVDFCENTVSKFDRTPTPKADIARCRKVFLPKGVEHQVRRYTADAAQTNGAIETTVQIGVHNIKDIAIVTLLTGITASSFFDNLRTKQQLGYVATSLSSFVGNITFRFIVQSNVCPPHQLVAKVKEFFPTLIDTIETYRADQGFEKLVESTKDTLSRRKQNQIDAHSLFWDSFTMYNEFNFTPKVVKQLETITIDDLLTFVKRHFLTKSELRIFSTLIYPKTFEIPTNDDPEIIILNDFGTFRAKSLLCPAIQNPTSPIQN